ncbi:MAG TPA: outer membrane beta-barrel protein [Candidatus Aquabacterium excrementipullorum]|nr:outer membrane beta-barrel protein [Candidatus Aquabacterium excrementipullorum]
MKFQTSRIALSAKRVVYTATAMAGLMAAAGAQAELLKPGSVYAGAGIGILETGYECDGAPICEHPRAGGKIFGGYRFTPNLAAEVTYFYLGNFKSAQGAGTFGATDVIENRLRNSAVSLAIDWSNEVFQVMTTHVRFGLAVTRTNGSVTYGNGNTEQVNDYATKPYLGLGLSYQFNPYLRFYSGYDVLRNKDNNHIHVLSLGLGIEN